MTNRFLNRSSTLLLLLLYVFSITYFIADCFGFTLNGAAPLWLGGMCVFVWITADFRRGIFIGLPLSALLLYAAYKFYDGLLGSQLMDFFDKIAGAYYERFYALEVRSYTYANLTDDHTLVLLFVAFLLASYLSTGLTSRGGRIFFSMLGTVPPFLFSVFVTGKPNIPAIVCLMLFWALLLAGGGHYKVDSPQGRAVYAAVLPAALLLGLILVIQQPSHYKATQRDLEASQRFNELGSALRGWMKDSASRLLHRSEPSPSPSPSPSLSPSPGPSPDESEAQEPESAQETLDLAEGYDFSTDPALQVRADSGGFIYLRSRSHGDYTGVSWLEASEPGGISSLPFAAYAAQASGGQTHQMELELYEPSEQLLLPYFSFIAQDSDSYVPSGGQSDYSASYLDMGAGPTALPQEIAQAEESYRAFAHEYYTRLPEASLSALQGIAQRAGLSADSPDIIQQVAEYVRNTGTYDLNVEPYPTDDYAVYFLIEARRGYCIHFATAATALYRALGIPARLTEGYLFTAVPGEFVQVLHSDAHAWVEVYSDGVGWFPVEVTGRNGLAPAEEPAEEPVEETAPPSPSPSPEQSEPSPTPSPEPSPSPTPAVPSPSPSVGLVTSEGRAPEPEKPTLEIPWKLLGTLAALLLAVASVPLRRILSLRAADRRFSQSDRRKAAVAIWKRAGRLSRYGPPIPQEIVTTAERAAFSQHEITAAELRTCRTRLDSMSRSIYQSLSPLKKLAFKYLKCFM